MINLKQYSDVIRSVSIFGEIDNAELASMLDCLGAQARTVPKNDILLLAGEKPETVGVVLEGLLHIVREDYDGSRALIAAAAPGELFAEALCCAGVEESPITVLASEDSTVLLLRFDRILHMCPTACVYHQKLLENMLKLVAVKNLRLQDRIDLMAAKTIRERVLRYLETLVVKPGQPVTVPFNREELAAYLCVERSALSHELMKMKRDGIIGYRKNVFTLSGRISE